MGLISWTKRKYYDYLYNKANKLVIESRHNEADDIYRELLGKHPMAVVSLANILIDSSDNVKHNLSALKFIEDLKGFTEADNYELYNNELKTQISNIEKLSKKEFEAKQYDDAARLIDAIVSYRKDDKSFMKRCHQIHAFQSFNVIFNTSDYGPALKETIRYLNLYKDSCKNDIKYFIRTLTTKSYYSRALALLQPFISIDQQFNGQINDIIIDIVKGKDKDFDEPNKLSDFCSDKKICQNAANHLYALSKEAAKNMDFAQSVLFDSFAAEFLSSDNSFNFTRCTHFFKNIESNPNALKIKDLLELADKLNLSEEQKGILKKDIAALAKKVEPKTSIEICRLLLSEHDIDQIYIEQAKKLASTDPKALDKKELMSVIKLVSDIDSFVDELAPFVQYVPEYEGSFVKSAIDKVFRHKSLTFLEKYWKVKEDTAFFEVLIMPSSELSKDTVDYVIGNSGLFLHSDTLLKSFLKALDSLNDNDYAYQVAENLHIKGYDVISFYLDKANKKCDTLSDNESIELIDHTLSVIDFLHNQNSSWIPIFIRKRNIQGSSYTTLSQKSSFLKETIDTINKSSLNFRDLSEPSYFKLWQEYTSLILKKSESQPKIKAIEDLSNARSQIKKYCPGITQNSISESLTNRIAKLRWITAKELEEDCDYANAIIEYGHTINEEVEEYKSKASYRRLICFLKSNKLYKSLEKEIGIVLGQRSNLVLSFDLAYRYACYLLKNTRPQEAESVIKEYIPTETDLLEICKNMYALESKKYLTEFNSKMAAVANGSMPLNDAIAFLKEFKQYKTIISRSLTDTTNKFVSYRRKLETYVIKSLFDEEKYDVAFSLLQKAYPNFFEDDTHFRNVAIAALGIIEDSDGSVDDGKMKYAIAIWLSAVFNDRLFVKSLDYTSWDDQFTFTLQGSLGLTTEDDYDDLPDNVNFDDPVDNQNVAIADVQNSLISRVETLIRDKYPQLESFFNSEKDALERLIALDLDEVCIIASPYFALKHQRILDSIKDAMDNDLTTGYGYVEKILSLGMRYGFSSSKFADYKKAHESAEKCKQAISGSLTQFKKEMSSISIIKGYKELYASLKAFFSSRMNDDIKSKMNYKKFIDIYEVVCKTFKDTALSLNFSQYANGEVVRLLNDEKMLERDGAVFLAKIHSIAPSDIQVKENLEGILKSLVADYIEKGLKADETALNKAISMAGPSFQRLVDISTIIQKVNKGKMTHSSALSKLYDYYLQDQNNDELCKNLATLCDICIFKYIIQDEYGRASVETLLNKIYKNRSTCFNKYSSIFANSLLQILGEMDATTRLTIISGVPGTTTLNSKGRALRTGLQYFLMFAPDGTLPDMLAKFLKL